MNALCLENYGVSKMETREMKTTDGGIAPILVFGLMVAAGALVYDLYKECECE
jgi:lactobin A/cerein 7B family class IIb bacteriocin